MQWYISKLVFQLVSLQKETIQFNEQINLIEAEDELQAFNKARIIGDNNCLLYKSEGTKINFIDVSELELLEDIKIDLSLKSNMLFNVSAEDYICKTQKKAYYIFQKSLNNFEAINNFN